MNVFLSWPRSLRRFPALGLVAFLLTCWSGLAPCAGAAVVSAAPGPAPRTAAAPLPVAGALPVLGVSLPNISLEPTRLDRRLVIQIVCVIMCLALYIMWKR